MRPGHGGLLASIAVLVATSAAAADPGPLRSPGSLAIEARADLVLGRDPSAVLQLRRPEAGDVHLVTNAGRIGAPIADHGGLRAVWSLPTERWPRVAIIAAVDDAGRIRDWLAVPLAGRGRVTVATSPGAMVSLTVAGVDYGPVRASARGAAVLDIEAPPGLDSGTARATDRAGNTTDQPAPLNPKAFATALVSCHADGSGVEVLAITATGGPPSSAPAVTASVGELAAPTEQGPGWYQLAYRAGSATATDVTITTRSPVDPSLESRCTMAVPPEPPASVRLAASRATHVAGSGDPITLTVELDYPGHRPPAPTELELVADLGTITPARMTTTDAGRATWSLPDGFGGKDRATVRVRLRTDAADELTTSTSVTLQAGPVASIRLQAPPRVRADGRSSAVLVVHARDGFGNPVATARLTARARGQVGPFTARAGADAGFEAAYTAPVERAPGDDRVQVIDTESGVSADATVPLAPIPRRFTLAGRLGYLETFGAIAALQGAATATMRLPLLDEAPFVGLEAGFATGTATVATPDGAESIAADLAEVPVVARLGYRHDRGRLALWASVDGGALAVRTTTRSASSGTHRAWTLRPTVGGALGVGLYARPLWLIGEVGYRAARLDAGTVTGQVGGLALSAGVGVDL